MIFNNFINKTNKYLKSVRILKTYVSFDMIFSDSWSVLKNTTEGIEVLENVGQDGIKITSFVCQIDNKLIDILELYLDEIIRTNIEKEEKGRLFKLKVTELKNIFENENLDNLRGLKFDVEEFTKLTIDNNEKTLN
jgi:hypothetical protein